MFEKILNIPTNLKPLIVILGVSGFLFSSETKISEETFLFCLKPNVEPLVIEKSNDSVEVANLQINKFIQENNIIDIEEWIPGATDIDRDGDIFLNRIYRVFISPNDKFSLSNIINKIESLSIVLYAENEFLRKPLYVPNDPMAEVQCSLNSVKATQAWDFWDIPNGMVPNGEQVLLASVDTGVDYTHPDIQDNSWINQAELPEWVAEVGMDQNNDGYYDASEIVDFLQSEGMDANGDGFINLRDAVSDGSPFEDFVDNDGNGYTDDLLGWDSSGDFGTDDNDPFPKEGVANNSTWAHGTHVAGILAATSDNELGMASTAYNAKYISVKVSRGNQSGEPGINDGYAGITYAAKAGYYAGTFTIINNSWGGGGYSASENATINNAHNTYGAVIVCAAGNGNDDGSEDYGSHYPSSYENSVSVCAMGCSYNWGNWATYHYTVDLAAPGESIHSAIIGTGYEAWDGSSMASPNAASCFGLLKAYYPSWNNELLEDRLYASADRRVYELNPEYETCNGNSGEDCFGYGMVDIYKAIGMDFSPNVFIDTSYIEVLADDDGVFNPGETASLKVSLENEIGWVDASALMASLSTDNPDVVILNDVAVYGTLLSGNTSLPLEDFQFSVSENIELGDIDFTLEIVAIGDGGYQYSNTQSLDINVSIMQSGFPFDTNSEIKSSPLVVDLDGDDISEVVFADQNGEVRILQNGQELINDAFPYNTGNQVWGSISSADMDLDGVLDFVVASKSNFLYIFDINGLKAQYDADRFLIGTPIIGNLDSDDELEVVVGGYSSPTSSNSLFAINHDGTEVSGFPFIVGEKIKSGAALADMNDNGIDDIIFGTDSDNIHVLLDDLTYANGFPIDLGDRIQSEPAVYDTGDEKIILTGCKNNNFYAINFSDASLRFTIPTGDDVYTSPSFNNNNIYFGSDDGNIYAVDYNGNMLEGYPHFIGSEIIGSIVFSGNENEDIMFIGTSSGDLYAYYDDLELLPNFPINHEFSIASSPMVMDIDSDGDVEVLCGTAGDILAVDIKDSSIFTQDYWSVYKGNNSRTGYFMMDSGSMWGCETPQLSDINCDSIINILDIVTIVNMVIDGLDGYSNYELWAADVNSDNIINILDIVFVVNVVIEE